MTFERYVSSLVALACGVVIVAGILFSGYVVQRYDRADTLALRDCEPADAIWFCAFGTLGNGC